MVSRLHATSRVNLSCLIDALGVQSQCPRWSRWRELPDLHVRQFGRAFRSQTGETPAKAVERLRVEAACACLHSGAEPTEQIAISAGFSNPERMCRAFVKLHGHPPQEIRRSGRQDNLPSPAT